MRKIFKKLTTLKHPPPCKFLYITGLVIIMAATFAEVAHGKGANFKIFCEATKLFWQGIVPFGDGWRNAITGLDVYLYGPVFNVIFAPFAYMPSWLSPFLWNLLHYSLYFIAIFTLPNKFSREVKCKIFLYTFLIVATSLFAFQANVMVAYIFLFAFSLLENKKPFWAIVLIVLSGSIKVYGIFQLGLLVCYPKFWRNILYVLVVVLAFILLPVINAKIGDWCSYYGSWIDSITKHKFDRPWQTFYYMQPWKNISDASVYIQVGTLAALITLFFASYKKFDILNFRLQAIGILMGWMVLFSNAADTHTYVISIVGYTLWYWSQNTHERIDKILFYSLLVVVVIIPIDVLCPPVVMRFLFWKLSLHLWLLSANLLRMCYVTFNLRLQLK